MADRNLKYDYESKNKEFEKNGDNKDCINHIIIKPIVIIDITINGLSSIVNQL